MTTIGLAVLGILWVSSLGLWVCLHCITTWAYFELAGIGAYGSAAAGAENLVQANFPCPLGEFYNPYWILCCYG